MIPGTRETGTPPADLDRKIEQHLLALKLTEAKQNAALHFNLARMADYRNDQAEALRRYERSLVAFKTRKEPPEGAVPVVEARVRELNANDFNVTDTPGEAVKTTFV